MRMFVAAVPPPEVLDVLERFIEPRRDADDMLRWTDPFQWHITLAFYAEVPDRRVEDLQERLRRACARRQSLEVRVGGAGAFPSAHRAKVLWLGAHAEPVDGLSRLAEGATAAAVRAGVEVEGGRFRAHLTLARTRQPVNVTRWLRVFETVELQPWTVDSVHLIESHLGEGPHKKPRYQTLESFPLGTSSSGDAQAEQVG